MNGEATQAAQSPTRPDRPVVRTMRRVREHPKVVPLRHSVKKFGGHILEVTEDDFGVVELHEQ